MHLKRKESYILVEKWDDVLGGWMDIGIECFAMDEAVRKTQTMLERDDEDGIVCTYRIVDTKTVEYSNSV